MFKKKQPLKQTNFCTIVFLLLLRALFKWNFNCCLDHGVLCNNSETNFTNLSCIEGCSSGLESQQSVGGDIESGMSSTVQPRLHRQKLPNKPNRGKTFRSFKSKTAANIEVLKFYFLFKTKQTFFKQKCVLYRYRILRWSKNW
jgi:hypothetical protein